MPPGVAISGEVVEAVAGGDADAIAEVDQLVRPLAGPLAVRSSAVDEDGADASFAGQHLTLLNVPSADEVAAAVSEVWWSANSDSAITYRQRVGLFTRPSVGVVVQSLLDPECAGVMFTRNPITGDDERVIEASWGLGEAVVAGLVIPDNFRIDRGRAGARADAGAEEDGDPGAAGGGTVEQEVAAELRGAALPGRRQLAALHGLAERCEHVYGPGRDIEWAFADGQLYLLQCRAITRAGGDAPRAPATRWRRSPQRAALRRSEPDELRQIAALFKERRFAAGETVIQEGSGGAAFFVIESGEANVSIGGEQRGDAEGGRLLRRDRADRRGGAHRRRSPPRPTSTVTA